MGNAWSSECDLPYTATVSYATFYALAIADVHPFTVSYTDLSGAGWKLALSVGP